MTAEVIQVVEEQFIVVDNGEPMLLVDDAETIIISEGEQGPMGPRGLPALASVTDIGIANTALGGYRVVRLNALDKLDYASAAVASHALAVAGITAHAATAGAEVAVQSRGKLEEPSWTWQADKPVYLGANGVLTQVEPVAPSSAFLLVVGYAVAPTILLLTFGSPIQLS